LLTIVSDGRDAADRKIAFDIPLFSSSLAVIPGHFPE
jgi:hypothetical protein